MKYRLVQTECFTPIKHFTDRRCIKALLILSTVFGLSGCVTLSNKVSALAPSPPEVRFSTLYQEPGTSELNRYLIEPKPDIKPVTAKDVLIAASGIPIVTQGLGKNLSEEKDNTKKCRFKDRFDRKAVLAYEWGRNRLALDIDGLSLAGADVQAFKLQYRLRLQPEKTRTEKCRFQSSWQGLIGSGYNELFLRDEDTVFEEFKQFRQKVDSYVDRAF
jgi:hypothetical protein